MQQSFSAGFALNVVGHNGVWVAGAHADGSLELRVVGRFLSRRQSRRQRVDRQTREDLGHQDRSRGEQPYRIAWSEVR